MLRAIMVEAVSRRKKIEIAERVLVISSEPVFNEKFVIIKQLIGIHGRRMAEIKFLFYESHQQQRRQ